MYNDFLVSFIINLINTVIGYLVSKKYFNSDNSTFYQMIYGTMFIRFMIILSLMLFLISYQYVNMIPFFISFVCFYVLFQAFEISSSCIFTAPLLIDPILHKKVIVGVNISFCCFFLYREHFSMRNLKFLGKTYSF